MFLVLDEVFLFRPAIAHDDRRVLARLAPDSHYRARRRFRRGIAAQNRQGELLGLPDDPTDNSDRVKTSNRVLDRLEAGLVRVVVSDRGGDLPETGMEATLEVAVLRNLPSRKLHQRQQDEHVHATVG